MDTHTDLDTDTHVPRRIALVSGDAAGREGLAALLSGPGDRRLRASLASPQAFWQLMPELLWSLDELLVHPASLDGGHPACALFIAQVRRLLPRLRVLVLDADNKRAAPWRREGVFVVDYGAPLGLLLRALSAGRPAAQATGDGCPPLTRGEWGALAGTLAGQSVSDQARRTGRSTKTVYALRATGLHKLGIARVDELLLYPGTARRYPDCSD